MYYNFVKLIWSYSWYALFAGKYFVNLIHCTCTLSHGYVLVLKYCWIIKVKDSWVQDIEKSLSLLQLRKHCKITDSAF